MCSRGLPECSAAQRARTREPMFGMDTPITTAHRYRVQCGARVWMLSSSPARPLPQTRAAGMPTRAWPRRSTSRARNGAEHARTRAIVADTVPATA
ncbi:MAG TPA: hypothetical protein VGX23_20965 [Actinocrinis sp.]|nr:hypothetical protein [Actinocrinis sp.]